MTRFFLSAAFGLALALPALAQGQPQPRPNRGEDVEKLREQVRDLVAKLKQVSDKKEEKEDDKKGEKKKEGDKKGKGEQKGEGEPKGPPMGGFTGGFSGPMGSFGGQGFGRNPFAGNPGAMPGGPGGEGGRGGSSGMSGGPDFTKMPGFYRLSQEEQKTLAALMQKLRTPPPERSGDAPMGVPSFYHGGPLLCCRAADPVQVPTTPEVGEADEQHRKEDHDVREGEPRELVHCAGVDLGLAVGHGNGLDRLGRHSLFGDV